MGEAIVSDLFTEILTPVAAVIGIAFAPFQWVLVSKVKLLPEPPSNNKNDLNDHLLKEEGHSIHDVVAKCSGIQNAVSEVEVHMVVQTKDKTLSRKTIAQLCYAR